MKDTTKAKAKEGIDNVAGAGSSDKLEGKARESKGRAKEALGAATGNDKLRAKGVKDQASGKGEQVVGELKHAAEGVLDSAKKALKKH